MSCLLCGLPASRNAVHQGTDTFCCVGCHAVYQILSEKNQLDQITDHPIFKQAVQSGLISNPELLEHIRSLQVDVSSEEKEKLYLEIGEMWCPACAEVIQLVLQREKGVCRVVVDYATDLALIEFSPRFVGKDTLLEKITALGYIPKKLEDPTRQKVSHALWLRFAVSAFFSLNIMMFSYPLYATYFYDTDAGSLFAWLSAFSSLPVLLFGGGPILKRFWSAFTVGIIGMEALVTLGVGAAFLLSWVELFKGGTHVYFDSMSVIITLMLLGKIIEAKAKFSTKETYLRLTRSIPRRGRKRFSNGESRYVPIKEILPGETLIVTAGERIVLDGTVLEGDGSCDESLMTGEATPVRKEAGERALAGTLLQSGWLAIEVTSSLEETALHKIIEMVAEGIEEKTEVSRVTDTVISWVVPLVLLIGISAFAMVWFSTGNFAEASLRLVTVFLIACPCALGIAAPIAEASLLNRFASMGVIVRNRRSLAFLGKETVFAFDKTGTVTEGRFRVLKGLQFVKMSPILKGLALQSSHPVACALAGAIDETPLHLEKIHEFPGRGIRGEHGGETYFLGSGTWMALLGYSLPPEKEEGLITYVYFASSTGEIRQIILGDQIRPEIGSLLEQLGTAKKILLSGDGKGAVKAVAAACHFDTWFAGCSPLRKREVIDQYRKNGEIVVMTGDGINDAPALTAAHVGVSVVSAADISIQVSDLLLTEDSLSRIPQVRQLAVFGRQIIRQNLFWAFFYNAFGVGLACAGWLTPLYAAFAMVTSSLIVLFNTKRL